MYKYIEYFENSKSQVYSTIVNYSWSFIFKHLGSHLLKKIFSNKFLDYIFMLLSVTSNLKKNSGIDVHGIQQTMSVFVHTTDLINIIFTL